MSPLFYSQKHLLFQLDRFAPRAPAILCKVLSGEQEGRSVSFFWDAFLHPRKGHFQDYVENFRRTRQSKYEETYIAAAFASSGASSNPITLAALITVDLSRQAIAFA